MTAGTMRIKDVPWNRLAVFFLIACAWSWPFFWLRDMQVDAWSAMRIPHPLKNMLLMWGPGISALICLRIFKPGHRRTITLTGTHAVYSVAFYVLPFLALAAAGVNSAEFGPERVHAMILLIAAVGFINILGEELGWRGFLQDALRGISRPLKYLLIGALWTLWHFTNIFAHRDAREVLAYLAWYFPLTVALSALIGESTERTRSLFVAVTLHSWLNLLWEFKGPSTYAVFAVSLLFWAWLLHQWPKPGSETR